MVYLRKDGIFYENDVDSGHEEYVYKQVDSVIPYLDDAIEFDDDLTLKDFFSLFEVDEKMMEIVFGSHLGHFPLRPYMDEVKQDCMPDGKESEIDHIECSWAAEQFDYRLFYEKHKNEENSVASQVFLHIDLHEPDEDDVNEFSLGVNVCGIGPFVLPEGQELNEDYDIPIDMAYGIEFTPLHTLAHLPIKLNTSIKIYDRNELGPDNPLVEAVKSFTVFEAIGGLLSEISFCGSPEERDEHWQDIVEDVEEAKEKLAEEEDEEENEEDAK